MIRFLLLCFLVVIASSQISEETLPFAHEEIKDRHPENEELEDDHWGAFFASIASIFVSEIGDRTFFVAAIMAMTFNKQAVFVGGAGALVLMTFISCVFGLIATKLIPKVYTQILAMILFFFFGGKLLYDFKYGEESDEKEEVEEEMKEIQKKLVSNSDQHQADQEAPTHKKPMEVAFQTIAWQTFIMTFLGEWGDRSQFATIALAANHHAWIVFLGGSLVQIFFRGKGHIVCTIMAILGGQLISERITPKQVCLIGGILFTAFGFMQGYQVITGSD